MVNRFFMDKLRLLAAPLNWLQIGNKRNIIKREDRQERFGNYSRYPLRPIDCPGMDKGVGRSIPVV